jgi:DNA-nicking Smr family endonuclease
MVKKKGKKKPAAPAPRKLHIELEPNAHEIFADALHRFSTTAWEEDKLQNATKAPQQASSRPPADSLDLHGMTLEEAQMAVDVFLQQHLLTNKGLRKLKIVTGKGDRAGRGAGILSRESHGYVERNYRDKIVVLEASPAETELQSGKLWRGHFHLTLRCS